MTINIIRTIAHDINSKNKTMNEECIEGLVSVLGILEELEDGARMSVLMFCLRYLEHFEEFHEEWVGLLEYYEIMV